MNSDREQGPVTFFASAERLGPEEIDKQIRQVCDNSLFNSCLNAFGGVVLVLNQCRQIITANTSFLEFIGIESPESLLGLRPGEALKCIRIIEAPNGCGTGRLCRDCGAVIAIVASQVQDRAVQRECLMTTEKENIEESFEFRVSACPITLSETGYTLITMQDIRKDKRFEVMERIFLHDMANLVTALYYNARVALKAVPKEQSGYGDDTLTLIDVLSGAIKAQRDLVSMEAGTFSVRPEETSVSAVFEGLRRRFGAVCPDETRSIRFTEKLKDPNLCVSNPLLHRVLENMLKNALDAAPAGSAVHLYCEEEDDCITFHVWNQGAIPENVAPHVFQRHFSTKEGVGHGLGTYIMKLIGERYLGGKVRFETSQQEGTRFSLRLPRRFSPEDDGNH